MPAFISRRFSAQAPEFGARLILLLGGLLLFNIGAWLCALLAFRDKPALLGVALAIYGLGLRHAVDADHIAAIDNVTRKLMQLNQRPVAVGFFFAMGHSAVVMIVGALVASAAAWLARFQELQGIGGRLSAALSASFLFVIAATNIVIFVAIYRSYRRLAASGTYSEVDFDLLLNNRGLLARIFRTLFRFVAKSWHMFFLGFLFGLGFDTATEIAMFGIAAAQAGKGLPLPLIMLFPALFAAGMSLLDSLDGIMMLGAYDWASVKPMRKIFYNMTLTLVSVVAALLVGGIEVFGLLADHFALKGGFWDAIGELNDHSNALGFGIVGLFAAVWALSYVIYKVNRLDGVGSP